MAERDPFKQYLDTRMGGCIYMAHRIRNHTYAERFHGQAIAYGDAILSSGNMESVSYGDFLDALDREIKRD